MTKTKEEIKAELIEVMEGKAYLSNDLTNEIIEDIETAFSDDS